MYLKKMKKFFVYIILAFAFTLFSKIDLASLVTNRDYGINIENAEPDSDEQEREKVELETVVDGDTIWVKDSDSKSYKVRFIGVNTPESVHEDENKNSEEGKTASDFLMAYLEKNCTDNVLYLEYDVERFDKYDRTLAYVYLSNDVMLQEVLLSNGMAECMFVGENIKYKAQFEELENQAKQEKIGFWK